MSFRRAYWLTFILLLFPILLGASTVSISDPLTRVRSFTRAIEFDYLSWTLNALGVKFGEIVLGTADYLPEKEQSKTVLESLDLIRQINQLETQVNDIYSDPNITDPEAARWIYASNWTGFRGAIRL
jgi:hypothetical protein